jgi:hypothetical protein
VPVGMDTVAVDLRVGIEDIGLGQGDLLLVLTLVTSFFLVIRLMYLIANILLLLIIH